MHRRTAIAGASALLFAAFAFHSPVTRADDVSAAQDRVNAAAQVVDQMKQNPHLAHLLNRAEGVFIVPRFGKGAFIVGGQGGAGVVLVKRHGDWTDPAFYNIGGGSVGLQAGGSGGSVAMLLMTHRAVRQFEDTDHRWSLNGGAGLTIAEYSGNEEAHTGDHDVIVWSDVRGLYGGLTAGVTHISPDRHVDHAYYQRDVGSHEILSGQARNHQANVLRDALGTRVASE
jgi:lipid-binding SYLF domain-containing protein